MTARLYKGDAARLLKIADLVDEEATSWRNGFAASYGDGRYVWDKEYPEEHARYLRLRSAAQFLRTLSNRSEHGMEVKP